MKRQPLPVIDHPLVDTIRLYLKTNPHMEGSGAAMILRDCARTIGQAAAIMRDATQLTAQQEKLIRELRAENAHLRGPG